MPSSMKNRQHEFFSVISRVRYRPTLKALYDIELCSLTPRWTPEKRLRQTGKWSLTVYTDKFISNTDSRLFA